MERARIRRRRQQFQRQFDVQDRELRSALALQQNGTSVDAVTAAQQARHVLQLRYELGELCAQYDEFRLAGVYFQQVLKTVQSARAAAEPTQEQPNDNKASVEQPAQDGDNDEEAAEMAALHVNALNWLAIMHFRAGDQQEAMGFLLDAKKLSREKSELLASTMAGPPQDKPLAVNYALFLHARENVADAEHAALAVVDEGDLQDPTEEPEADTRARSAAFMLLASICKARGDGERAMTYSERAVELADRAKDPRLSSRAHNNLGIHCLEQNDLERALERFASAYRATQQTKEFEQQAIVKYHLGLTLAYIGRNIGVKQELGDSEDEDEDENEKPSIPATMNASPELSSSVSETTGPDTGLPVAQGDTRELTSPAMELSVSSAVKNGQPLTKTPKELFLESENLASALPTADEPLRVLAQCCRGEEEYYAGEFHTAEAEFSIALGQLRSLAGGNIEEELDAAIAASSALGDETQEAPEEEDTSEKEAVAVLPPLPTEVAKLQGLLLSYMGCTQLVEGKFSLAERSHKRDLALALRQEDLHAQHRALRNLAIVLNATQRYVEAVPLWREAHELSVVLSSKGEQLMALSGLGTALKELAMMEGPAALAAINSASDTTEPLRPLQIFLRQRALAEEVGDLHQQILAQRHIVSVYESSLTAPQTASEAGEALERRLGECDVLVQLCEHYENLQYRADAYRSLANALTAQLIRLRARARGDGSGVPHYGLNDAIAVLSHKRDSVCASYQEASTTLSLAAVSLFQDSEEQQDPKTPKPKQEERHARAPLTRLEVLQRR